MCYVVVVVVIEDDDIECPFALIVVVSDAVDQTVDMDFTNHSHYNSDGQPLFVQLFTRCRM